MFAVGVRRGRLGGAQQLLLMAAALTVLSSTGCWKPPGSTINELNRGLVYLFPGIEGREWAMQRAWQAARDSGVDAAIEVYQWPSSSDALTNLTAYERNRAEARRVADHLTEYARSHPGAAIDLAGYSGGGGLAVLTAEALPEDVKLRNVLLVQCALSPDYDLEPALRRVDGQLVNFHSQRDWLILGVGTQTFGTIDRKYVPAAGKDGFDADRAVRDAALRRKLRQIGWREEWLAQGHDGGHPGMLTYPWNRKYVAPYFKNIPLGGADAAAPVEVHASSDGATP